MTASTGYTIANVTALVGWAFMALGPRWKGTHWVVHKGLLPLVLSTVYLLILLGNWGKASGDFKTLQGLHQLFTNDWALLTGWVHYLAYDMIIASWALQDSWKREISHAIMLPILFCFLMFGPAGYVLYRVVASFRPLVEQEV